VALPSIFEGMPNAVLDALAAGVPVVATPAGGTGEIVEDGVTGWLVPFHAPRRLAAALARVLDHPEEAAALARAGRRRVLEHHVPAVMTGLTEAAYRLALGRRRGLGGEARPGVLVRGATRTWGIDGAVRDDLMDRFRSGRGLPGRLPPDGRRAGEGPTGRGPVLRDLVGGRPAVLKTLRHGGWPGRLLGMLPGDGASLFRGDGRLRRATRTASFFRARGGTAPRPLGWLSMASGPWRRLVLATEELADMVTLDRPLAGETGVRRTALLASAGRAVARWHHAGLIHPDMNLGNLLIRHPTDHLPTARDLYVIDLEGARLVRRPGRGARAASLVRLERSAVKLLGDGAMAAADRWRFLVAYSRERTLLEVRPPADAGRLLRALLPALRWRRWLFILHGLRV
jgi:hypothetical protein